MDLIRNNLSRCLDHIPANILNITARIYESCKNTAMQMAVL